jgi:hypothetical protein
VRGIDLYPDVYYGENLSGGKIGEGEVVGGGEGQDVAFACYGGGSEEEVREV